MKTQVQKIADHFESPAKKAKQLMVGSPSQGSARCARFRKLLHLGDHFESVARRSGT